MKKSNLPRGRRGESLAVKHLRSKGYKILDRNFYKRGGEIDIIATKANTLVFIEVKTRTSTQFGKPEEAITPRKIRLLTRTAEYYVLLHPGLPDNQRLDVIAIEMSESGTLFDLRHIENITG